MLTEHRAMLGLRVFLVALFGILVVLETLSIPGSYAYMAQQNPEEAYLRWPSTIVSVFWVVCVQVVIVATWKLLTLVRKDLIFTEAAMRWVDVMVWAIAAAWVVLVGGCSSGSASTPTTLACWCCSSCSRRRSRWSGS